MTSQYFRHLPEFAYKRPVSFNRAALPRILIQRSGGQPSLGRNELDSIRRDLDATVREPGVQLEEFEQRQQTKTSPRVGLRNEREIVTAHGPISDEV